MSQNCKTCKWGRNDSWGHIECKFPVPAWLLATVRGLEDSRGVNRLGERLLPNEVNSDHEYTNCGTWEEGLESRKTGGRMNQRIGDQSIKERIRFYEECARENGYRPERVEGWEMAMDLQEARAEIKRLQALSDSQAEALDKMEAGQL